MLTFVVHITAKAGKAAELQALLADVRDRTRANEPDVLYYDFAVGAGNPNELVVIEVYRDAAAQAAHIRTAWVRESLPATAPLLEAIEIRRYVAPVAGSDPQRR